MKHLYITVIVLIASVTQTYSQDELIVNQSFDADATSWTAVNHDTTASGWEANINHSAEESSGSYKLSETTGGNAHIKHTQKTEAEMKAVGDGGDYVFSFWVYGAQGNRIKVQFGNGGNNVQATFSENAAGWDNTITLIQADNTWQLVSTVLTLSDGWVTPKIFNVKDNTTTYIDDISLKRAVSEMPASGDLSVGWYPKNATSSIGDNTGIHTLNMDNNNPQLKSWDYSIDADVNKFITVEIKNNSNNDRLTIFHPKSSDPTKTRYVTLSITTNDVTTKTYEFNMTNNDWSGTIYPLTLYVRKWDPNGGNNGTGGMVVAEQSGDVEFHSITSSLTASFSEYYQPKLSIYPNPAVSHFVVENAVINDNLEIFNVGGKLIKTQTIHSVNEKIDIEELNRGIYFVRVNDSRAVRLIKK